MKMRFGCCPTFCLSPPHAVLQGAGQQGSDEVTNVAELTNSFFHTGHAPKLYLGVSTFDRRLGLPLEHLYDYKVVK